MAELKDLKTLSYRSCQVPVLILNPKVPRSQGFGLGFENLVKSCGSQIRQTCYDVINNSS